MKRRVTVGLVLGVALLLAVLPLLGACATEVAKEVVKEVPVEREVVREVVKEVPVEKVVEKQVIREVPVERVVEKEVIKEVPVQKIVEKEVIKEVSVEIDKSDWPDRLVFGTQVVGVTPHVQATAWGPMFKKYLGVRALPEVLGGTTGYVKGWQEKQDMMASSERASLTELVEASGKWMPSLTKFGPLPLRSIAVRYTLNYTFVARKDSGMKTMDDLKGKTVLAIKSGSAITKETWENILKIKGWTDSDIRTLTWTSVAEGSAAIKEKSADAWALPSSHPNANLIELASAVPVVLLAWPPELAQKLGEAMPTFATAKSPGGLYKGQDDPSPDVAVVQEWLVPAWWPDSFVHEICKVVFDHADEWTHVSPIWNGFSAKSQLEDDPNFTIPRHKGAINYFKEKGLWTAAMEERNKARLATIGQQE